MTISLLRRIWQRIIDKQAAPRQRLTGFEPLEPRMVLSGAMPHLMMDYFTPPPGDFSHVERTGAEYSKFAGGEYGRIADYNTPGPGGSSIIEPRQVQADRRDGFDNLVSLRDYLGGQGGFDGGNFGGDKADLVFVRPLSFSSFASDMSMSSASMLRSAFSSTYTVSVDHVMSDGDSWWIATSTSRFDGFTSLASVSLGISSSPLNSIEVRGLVPSNLNAVLERRMEAREAAGAASRGSSMEASLAHATGAETAAARTSAASSAVALLASQSDDVRSNAVPGADGSSANGQQRGQTNQTAAREQSRLDDSYAIDRRGMKRKLPGNATALDESKGEDADFVQVSDEGDAVQLIEAARQFDAAGHSGSQIPEVALANLPADGLIDVIAVDVNSRSLIADGKDLSGEVNRMVMIEPAMVAYQAFEVVVDGNTQAEHRVVDAADVATVAMNDRPVVQAE